MFGFIDFLSVPDMNLAQIHTRDTVPQRYYLIQPSLLTTRIHPTTGTNPTTSQYNFCAAF